MGSFRTEDDRAPGARRALADRFADWVKFGLGLLAVLALALLLSQGVTPPGPAGEVLRHNQRLGLDATPLFYTEVEHFAELEQNPPVPQDE